MNKKSWGFSLFLASSLVTGCTGGSKEPAASATEISYSKNAPSSVDGATLQLNKESNLRAAKHVTDGGPVTDQSFNQTIFKGLTDYNGSVASNSVVRPDPQSAVATKINLYKKTFESAQVIVAGGFQHTDALNKIQGEIPKNRGFIFIDGEVKNKNIASVVFNIEEAAFLSGYATAEYLNKMKSTYEKDGLKVGTFGGRNFPTVTSFMAGFQQGVMYYNNNLPSGAMKVEFIKLGSKPEDYFSGSFLVGKGKAMAQKLLSKGADVILPVAGPQTGDTLDAIKEKKSNALVVGVDTDQVKQYPAFKTQFLTSILKKMDVAVKEALQYIYKENEKTQYGLGRTTVGNLSNGLVGIAAGGDNKFSEGDLDRLTSNSKVMAAAKKAQNKFML